MFELSTQDKKELKEVLRRQGDRSDPSAQYIPSTDNRYFTHLPEVEEPKDTPSQELRASLEDYFNKVITRSYDFDETQSDNAKELFIGLYYQVYGELPLKKWLQLQTQHPHPWLIKRDISFLQTTETTKS